MTQRAATVLITRCVRGSNLGANFLVCFMLKLIISKHHNYNAHFIKRLKFLWWCDGGGGDKISVRNSGCGMPILSICQYANVYYTSSVYLLHINCLIAWCCYLIDVVGLILDVKKRSSALKDRVLCFVKLNRQVKSIKIPSSVIHTNW